jgi:hypothetical protein
MQLGDLETAGNIHSDEKELMKSMPISKTFETRTKNHTYKAADMKF